MAPLSEKQVRAFRSQGRGLFSGIQYRSRRSDFRKFDNGVTGQYRAGSSLPDFSTLSAQKAAGLCRSLQNDSDYIDFIVEAIRPIARQLVNGGSVVLNIGQDIFNPGQPSRSLYPERLLLALCEKLNLYLMDRVPWVNMSKPPSPTYWACRKKVQLLAGHEMIFWLTNNPDAVRSCNQRVLQPHTESHSALVARGGENRTTIYGDGAHVVKPGPFLNPLTGLFPKM